VTRKRPPDPPGGATGPERPESEIEATDARGSPAASAAPTTTAPRVRGRKRRLALALSVLVLGAGAVAAVVYLSGTYRQERAFQREAERVLTQLSDGSAEDVYEQASPRFQQTLIIDKFLDLIGRMRSTLGRFVRVSDVIGVEPAAGVAGMTARVLLELDYERGSTVAALSFHRARDGAWRLLGFGVEIPTALQKQAAALDAKGLREGAPPEVIELVRSILEGVREGRITEVHAAASPGFRGTVSIEGFQAMLQAHQAQLGNFVRVLGVVSSARNPDRDRARVQAILEYDKGKTTGTFEFMQVEGSWRLLNFKVVIPFDESGPAAKPL
jgi:mono/diheme cytochrome c family protein